ncbi:MAG TPA: hypothetical protein VF169_06555 [Albitalea sp.]|uniref:hypothetical protein n=1 Tax=Piscinibacter sp. TaxID=1903157 RepID=UPI002ED05A7D
MSRTWVLAALCAAVLATTSARADVVTFDFTGRISDTLLLSGIEQPAQPIPASWLGLMVSGTVRMDFETIEPRVLEPGVTQVSKTFDFPFADWMTVTVHQPDGSILSFPSGPAPGPFPAPESNDAYSVIYNTAQQDWFYAQRSFSMAPDFPQQIFAIDVRGVGAGHLHLTDSSDYRHVHFDVSQANWHNYGSVWFYSAAGVGVGYGFTVLSLTQAVSASPIPEPASSLTLVAGLALVIGAGRFAGRSQANA